MIGQIKGIIIAKQAPDLLVDVQGIGYEVLVSLGTFFDIPEIGGAVTLHTHFDLALRPWKSGHYFDS